MPKATSGTPMTLILRGVVTSVLVFALAFYPPLPWLTARWPAWAVQPTVAAAGLCSLVFFLQKQLHHSEAEGGEAADDSARPAEFVSFQRQWMLVYLITMLADWLQGTHMYTLYSSYNQPVGLLFGIGFTSSAVFCTFLGLLVDRYGRRNGCILFCLLELVINSLEHWDSFWPLAIGRVLGGMSTSLLFTSFESWMVSEHRRRGFKEVWIAETFAFAQMGNGFMAVLAGIISQVSSDYLGDIGPFQVAIALTALALLLVCFWPENYGGSGEQGGGAGGKDSLLTDSVCVILSDRRVLLLGLLQSFFEGAMYTFVINWVPTLARSVPGGKTPGVEDFGAFAPGQGWIFSAMMICISIGGEIFAGMLKVTSVERGSAVLFLAASLSMVVPIAFTGFYTVLFSFLLLETCVGAFFGSMATMRSRYLPDSLQTTIMNIFRVPLNVLVVTGTRLSDHLSHSAIFAVITSWFFIAACLQLWLVAEAERAAPRKKDGKKKD